MFEQIVNRYLAVADRLIPGRISGFYVVGSAALGAWHADTSDIDFVAVLNGPAKQLPALHILGNLATAWRALLRRQPHIPGTMNGVFVATEDISKPVTRIRPIASHSGRKFKWDTGFDVNPVMWKVLREKGITFRGPEPAEWGLDPEPGMLRQWTLDQLNGHWRSFAEKCVSGDPPCKPLISPDRVAAARVTGPPRLHCTVTTGEVISKDAAVRYALDTFGVRVGDLKTARHAGEFMLEVISDAGRESFRGLER
ncbi:nucleotidyltransferase domain-containing protein [Kibdelosporangium aridum]|uniref:Nucleotidyltransferase domain-containing protein n=1 Tax=Kibdelosporangium aridum TaxID=2030 RepID=A0A1Y5XXU8_KIBAR|nr:nucleotidyltransferase domain-containing protein [Kibdelosporangium aridum]SMD18528.1 Nucleotidyltransferase domain-containing protein [Kibdelosporangium aridum]